MMQEQTSERRQPKILAVDDQPANLMALEGALEPLDINLTCVTSGNDALGQILETNFDLVLMDVQMPEMDGFETAELIHCSQRTQNLPIIFITALSTENQYLKRGYELGAVDYITKPIDPSILRSKVDVFVHLHQTNAALQKEIQQMQQIEEELNNANKILRFQAETDHLTGLLNRRKGFEELCKEMSRVVRGKQELSLIMMDVDFFKQVNDVHGHNAGDVVLVEIARRLEKTSRLHDIIIRWGGEELLIVCPHTNSEQVIPTANRLLGAIAETPIVVPGGPELRVTASLGTASSDALPGCSAEGLLSHADDALYMAKKAGRNCVRTAI